MVLQASVVAWSLLLASQAVLAQTIPPQSRTTPSVVIPATGQQEPSVADIADGRPEPVRIPDDGSIRAGAPLAFRDNADGTISDLNTGLMWEKKCKACEPLHDIQSRYRWSGNGTAETIWDWLDKVNAEAGSGLAGYSDWRIPNVKELVTIVNYGRVEPALSNDFDGASCGDGCSDLKLPGCSCTNQEYHWTSTTFADFPAHALVVGFEMGFVDDRVKTLGLPVRAVRSAATGVSDK